MNLKLSISREKVRNQTYILLEPFENSSKYGLNWEEQISLNNTSGRSNHHQVSGMADKLAAYQDAHGRTWTETYSLVTTRDKVIFFTAI